MNIAAGLSDFHKSVAIVLKAIFLNNKRNEISYWDYKYFNSNIFYDKLRHYINCIRTFQKLCGRL